MRKNHLSMKKSKIIGIEKYNEKKDLKDKLNTFLLYSFLQKLLNCKNILNYNDEKDSLETNKKKEKLY